jgi:hypothetical protein
MRWSVFAALIFVALLVVGIQSSQTPPMPCIAHAGPPPHANARSEAAVEWQDKVESRPFVKREEARIDAVARARERLTTWLREKYPSIRYSPTAEFIDRNKLVKSETETKHVLDADHDVELIKIEMDVELSGDALKKIVQEDRNQVIEGRLWGLARLVGGLVLLFGAVAGSIRLDEWTKGYLTWPLRIGALVLGAGGAAVLWFVV